jgi:hypothetical protein
MIVALTMYVFEQKLVSEEAQLMHEEQILQERTQQLANLAAEKEQIEKEKVSAAKSCVHA